MNVSLGEVLKKNRGIGPGFDFVRIVLAISVLAWHVPETAGYPSVVEYPVIWAMHQSTLPMFFGLSGFLIAGSAARLDLRNFALNRGARIVPALFVEIALSALILGPLMTEIPVSEYFKSPGFFEYFLNLTGFIHYRLPGVFISNPAPTVNGSLWTIPFEILCYVVMAGLVFGGLAKRRISFIILAISVIGVSTFLQFAVMPFVRNKLVLHAFELSYMHGGSGAMLLPSFLIGAAAYAYRDFILVDGRIFALCIVSLLVFGLVFNSDVWAISPLALIVCPGLIYMVCYIGMINVPKIPYFSSGDYSYGIYLYGYPIQQSLVHLLPSAKNWAVNFSLGLLLATLFATFSWHLIENPILRLRKRIHQAGKSGSPNRD